MNKIHKHHDVIVAWAADPTKTVQWSRNDDWRDCQTAPAWEEKNEYRIKPEPPAKVYPVTGMDHAHLIAAYGVGGYEEPAEPNSLVAQGYERIANAALRHAIDSGQLVEHGNYMADVRAHVAKRNENRDMAIAKAVRDWYVSDKDDAQLARLIANVKD